MMEKLAGWLAERGYSSDTTRFEQYVDFVLDYNERVNLTAITDRREFEEKHLIDSLSAANLLPQNASVLDIGSGAGFPAVPLKLVREDLRLVMLDSTEKKTRFLDEVIERFGLTDCTTLHARVEDAAATDLRESFDVALARAVAPLPTLLEYAIPMVKVGGLFVAYKTDVAELVTAVSAQRYLHAELLSTVPYTLPNRDKRTLFVFGKTALTDAKYPRGGNKPRSYPL